MVKSVSPELVRIALEKVEGFAFERFAQDFLAALEGRGFRPLGGVGDGGADGLFESDNRRTYYQFTREENHRNKIRKTVARLREFGREVKTVYYLSARSIPHSDKEEDLLTEELGVNVKIRERSYITSHINDSVGTIAAYDNHLSSYTAFLAQLNRPNPSFHSAHVTNPSAYVFLQHEVTNRLGDRKLVHSLTDTLILWSLSDTDPDKGVFMTEPEITAQIFDQFPWAERLMKGLIAPRLSEMRNKKTSGREIRWYRKEDKYCLPYETRQVIAQENGADETLRIQFLDELKAAASELFDADEGTYQHLAALACEVIHAVFETQGLLFSQFLSDKEEKPTTPVVADCIDQRLAAAAVTGEKLEQYRELIEKLIRRVFYSGSPTQRQYLAELSRTYVLLFTLQAEPRIVDYLSTMSSSFVLYVGSDVIVKAISERFLAAEDQAARNLLRMAAKAGVSMFLSQCVLEEVYTHVRATYYEFLNYFADVEPYVTSDIARESDRILIRAYFYAKEEGHVRGWKSFLGHFMTYDKIPTEAGQEELRKYLVAEFGFMFTENDALESVCDVDRVEELARVLLEEKVKEHEELAYNTALLVHGIYGLRKKARETSAVSEFGYKTWWITNQTKVLKHTVNIVRERHAQYMMRPEFLLNFISLSPAFVDVRSAFASVFPSTFGIQLGRRLKEEVFQEVMKAVRQWKQYEPGRVAALMSDLSDRLKTDRFKRYDRTL